MAPDEGAHAATEADEIASEAGPDAGGYSAEESAMRVDEPADAIGTDFADAATAGGAITEFADAAGAEPPTAGRAAAKMKPAGAVGTQGELGSRSDPGSRTRSVPGSRTRSTRMAVAVLGAGGTMGLPIARNLARAGMDVSAWNRSKGKAEPLTADGVRVADTPAQAAAGADIVITVLSDHDAVLAAMTGADGALAQMSGSAVWAQMSTVGEAATESCAKLAAGQGVVFADAPVLGTRAPAEQGKLIVLASGPSQLSDQLQPVFDAIGQRTMWLGEAGAGTRLKLVVNTWVLAVVEAGAEAIALAEGLGLSPQLLLDAIEGGTLDLPYLRMKAQAIAQRNFEPSFRLALAAKDAGLIDEAARGHQLDLPLVTLLSQRFAQGAAEHGDEDFSATYLTSAPRSPR